MRAQADAVAGFAAALRELRESVGNPPFREMSGRSGAISHTTLHEATKGNRLPSWATTAEFVKACGEDPAAYRERWERANLAVRSAGAEPQTPGTVEETAASVPAPRPVPETAGETRPPSPVPDRRGRSRPARLAKIALVTAVIGAATGAAVVFAVDRGSGSGKDGSGPSERAKAALSPADCPVHATNPAPAPPTHKGDAARFVADITLPDCTRVGAGKTVTKVWRLKNTGTVPWEGYSLRRLDLPQRAGDCQTISEVPIADTAPGRVVDIRTDITTPKKPALCYVRFKMVDGAGRVAFPGSRPVNFQVIVEGP
ncbi:NBR1-Ig-like domain-containing protein [Actinomadura sp. WMMA1423]|uniref:NBR1-Ig-like domain-containing protein n=1 Tax=Actinomadura sp. WMMA1423 TaxID=2591108 RepID=UPI001F0FE2EC|nr:NBR1-Ig-like domain-containing protein [Actinomadura sp. WMMA1423]